MSNARLFAIVAVEATRRVMCQNPGCGHSVFAAIHVVEDDGKLLVLGSTCFAKRYGGAMALGTPAYSTGGGGGGALTEDERRILIENTAELVERFKQRHEMAMAEAKAKLRALRERVQVEPAERRARLSPAPYRPLHPLPQHPWPWQHGQNTSVAVVRAPDGQCWVRVLHRDGIQRLVPWPVFEGWDESFPPSVGTADTGADAYVVPNISAALEWLRSRGFSLPQVSRWPEVLKLLPVIE